MPSRQRAPVYDPDLDISERSHSDRGGGYSDRRPRPDPLYLQNSTEIYRDDVDADDIDAANDDMIDEYSERDEIVDPKLHGRRNRLGVTGSITRRAPTRAGRRRWCCITSLCVAAAFAVVVTVFVVLTRKADDTSNSDYIPYNRLVDPPSELSQWCTPADPNYDVLKCAESCAPADCCDYPPSYDLSCISKNELVCYDYHKSCVNLAMTGSVSSEEKAATVPSAPGDLVEVCDFDHLAVDESACRKSCEAASCCYMEDPEVPSCTSEQSKCRDYVPCFNLRAYDNLEAMKGGGDDEVNDSEDEDDGEDDEEPAAPLDDDDDTDDDNEDQVAGFEDEEELDEDGDVVEDDDEGDEDNYADVDGDEDDDENGLGDEEDDDDVDDELEETKAQAEEELEKYLDDDEILQDAEDAIEAEDDDKSIAEIVDEAERGALLDDDEYEDDDEVRMLREGGGASGGWFWFLNL